MLNAKRKIRFIALVVCLLQLGLPQIATACQTCKDGLHDGAAFAYAVSIVFMMAMPFIIFTFWIVMILKLRSKMPKIASEYE